MKFHDRETLKPAYHYHWNGLKLRSVIELAGLNDVGNVPEGGIDVTISQREPGLELPAAEPLPPRQRFVLNVTDVARYVILGGRRIVVQAQRGADPREVRLHLMGSAMGALSHQRGLLPMNASTVRVGNGCVSFVGPSGAGKSTLAAFVSRVGHSLVSDDVTVFIRGTGISGPLVAPGAGHVSLWEDAVQQLGLDPNKLERIAGDRDRYLLRLGAEPKPMPLTRVYVMEDGQEPELQRLTGTAARLSLLDNVYRDRLAGQMKLERQLVDSVASIVASIEVYRLTRVRGFECMADHVSLLTHHWRCSLADPAAGRAASSPA